VILGYVILNPYFSSKGITDLPKHPQKTNAPAIVADVACQQLLK